MELEYLVILALILISTKIFGHISQKVNMPQVVGALIAGIILGPSVLNVLPGSEGDFLSKASEIGVIILMFLAGLDTDISELKKTGIASLVIALIGVIVPLIGGTLVYMGFFGFDISGTEHLLRSVFVGVVLTATSVSITVETLREMGRLNGRMGTAILGAAIIDDIVGIIVLTIITSFKDPSANIGESVIKILLFFVFIAALLVIMHFIAKFIEKFNNKRRIAIYAFAFCLILSFCAEHYFDVADITGSYFAGIILCNSKLKHYIDNKVTVLSYMLFAPIFFASIGFSTTLKGITTDIVLFSLVLLIVAIISKMIGCGLGAKICRFSNKESLAIGVGMVSRGEVALIVAQKGAAIGLIDNSLFPAVVLVVIVTTVVTPILLKIVIGKDKNNKNNIDEEVVNNTLAESVIITHD